MAVDRVPYLVGGGFEHSAEVMRSALYASTGGAEGITSTGDLLVLPLAVPGTSVRVLPGAATLLNRYGGGAGQSYALRVASETEVPITATGSTGGRSDLIVARIDDPTYQGIAFDPATHEAARIEVIKGVPSTTRSLAGLNLTYPVIPLARVDVPASTGTITAGMVTDLRFLARPRRLRTLFTVRPTATKALQNGALFSNFPDQAFQVDVPSWATAAIVRAEAAAFWVNGSVQTPGDVVGGARVDIGGHVTASTFFHHVSLVNGSRFGASVNDSLSIPSSLRGTRTTISIQLAHYTGVPFVMDGSSTISVDVEFVERA